MSDLGNKEIMAKNIQYYMDLHQKTRSDMCKALGVKYTTFTDWVKGNAYPRIDKIELMANYFGIEKSDLVEKRDIAARQKTDYENALLDEAGKMNQRGKIKLLDTAREMNCSPLYNDDYKSELIAAHNDVESDEELALMRQDIESMKNDW